MSEFETPEEFIRSLSDEELKVRILCGDPVAEAWVWIKSYAEQLTAQVSDYDREEYGHFVVTADKLIDVGMAHADGGWEYISHGGTFEGVSTDPLFWEKLSILKGREIGDQGSFFSCSC